MNIWLKRSLATVGVFAACWLCAVWYWRATTRLPDSGDLALGLLGAPLALLTGWWVARQGMAFAATARSRSGAVVPSVSPDAAAATAAMPVAAPTAQLAVLAAALRMPHGDSAAELASAFEAGSARLELDPELTDAQGFPILAGRVRETDTGAVKAWLTSQGAALPAPHLLRAMALGGAVVAQLAQATRVQAAECVLQVAPLLPPTWSDAQREQAARWLLYATHGAGWPQDRLSLRTVGSAAPFDALQDIARHASAPAAPDLFLLLALDSSISEGAVAQMMSDGTLFGRRQPNGRIPGEGAAGLLLQRAAAAPEAVQILALQAGVPASPAESADGAGLAGLARAALAIAGTPPPQPLFIAADTDHRSSAMMELMQSAGSVLPQIDHGSQLGCIGAACGHSGSVASLAAAALAWHHAAASEGHALCFSNNDEQQRYALLLGPAAAVAPTLT
ncbi:hypothetical protein AB4Z19_16550 [Pseudoduganella sp. RAF19]|uniref:hypothetical protein n=1 Tax=Pseudoduganella sp. RAF19 TaxID=3233052 RepID=UPI003F9E6776